MDRLFISKLIDVIAHENKLYEEVLSIAKKKTDIIVEGKVAELQKLTTMEQSLVLQIGKLEISREDCAAKISSELGIELADLKISRILEHIEPEQAKLLKSAQVQLGNTIEQLKSLNDLNSKLIKNSLEYINFSMNILTDIESNGNNYKNTGEVGEGSKRNFFDIKL
ncbi:MAG TPA: flagellar protein FlgN [Clostridia bacterium]